VEDHFSGLETQRVVFEKLEKVAMGRLLLNVLVQLVDLVPCGMS
jgi:hypothetical protein